MLFSVLVVSSAVVTGIGFAATPAAAQQSVGFSAKETVTSQVSNPTSLEFGPDDRLYVAQRFGKIKVFDVQRTGDNSYDATLVETIETVQNIPNHDDDGSYNANVNQREVTGLTVVGTAETPVVYVTSSDPRVGGGGSGTDTDLDTNSGTVSRLTLQNGSWEHDMLVRGLPRSEENHAPNGLQYYQEGGSEYLLIAQGGHTNQGAPSNNFAYTPEYALSAAILQINVTEIEAAHAEKPADNVAADYLYDLPTLNGTSKPFGGQDGENMAKLVQGDGVSVFSPGYRNPYDVERTADGQVYTIDNGPNGGWGGQPVGENTAACTNEPNEDPSESNADNLHYVTEGFYGGHPNPTRANPDGAGIWQEKAPSENPQQIGSTAGAVYDGYNGSVECDYRPAGEGDGALWTNGASTNGMDEYTASNFGGAMQGDLLTASFDGNVYRIQLTADGTDTATEPTTLLSPGNTPLDVEAVGDDGPFPGTVFVAEFSGNAVSAYEPNDYGGSGGGSCSAPDDASTDTDGDGYDNADEYDAGTDPCSAGSTPADYDGDNTSNLNDPDDDNDGIDDVNDEFAVDPDNGLSTTLPVELTFQRGSFNRSLEGVGFTGLMLPEDGSTDYQDLYVPGDTVFGGANPALTVEAVKGGDATQNDQQHAYQLGIDPPSEEFVVRTTVTGFTDDPDQFESAGIFVGTGDQDNYRKLTVNGFGGDTSGDYGVQLFGETGGENNGIANPAVPAISGSGSTTELELVVDPTTDPAPGNGVDEANVTGYYAVDGGERVAVGTTAMPTAWLTDSDQGLAVGVIATSYQGDEQFSVTWNDLSVATTGNTTANAAPTASFDVSPSSPATGEQVTFDAAGSSDPDGSITEYAWDLDGDGTQDASGEVVTTTFETAGDRTVTLTVTDDDGATDTATETVSVADAGNGEVVFAVNAGGSAYTAADGTTYQASSNTTAFSGGTSFSVSDSIANTTEDPLYQTELYGGKTADPAAPNLTVPVSNGTYEVTLKFAELFQDSSGQRVFDVFVEGEQQLDGYDIYAEVGNFTATDKSYTVEVTDGTVDVDFTAEVDNAKIGAVKITEVPEPAPAPEPPNASVAITPGSGIDASTYGSGSYQITNTGGVNITTVRVDLNETMLPDMVHDPFNTAGDDVGKEFTLDGGDVTVENVSYTNFHNGVDNGQGYDSLVVDLSGFEPGETMSFSLDNDPTSIDSTDLGSQAAGPVSGLELTGATVSVGAGDRVIESTVVPDGSAGGSEATVTVGENESVPTVDVAGVGLTDVGLSERHTAATVTDANQTVTITGAPANAEVTLLRVEAELNLTDVPDPVEIEPYEGNKAVDVAYSSATTNATGGVTVDVTLTNSTATGGQNYFVAVVEEPDGDTGPVSNYVVLDLVENSAPTVGSITDTGVSEGESVGIPVDATDPDGDALNLSVDGPGFVSLSDAGDGAGMLTLAPGSDAAGTYEVTVTADDGAATASESFAVYVDEPRGDGQPVAAINAGGSAYTAADGTNYTADTAFTGGQTFATGQAGTPTDPEIGNTDDDTLYRTERYGTDVAYDIPVANGTYQVTLQFAEIYQGVSTNDGPDSTTPPTDGTNENDRLFNASIEGEQVLTAYDIYSEVGSLNATDKSYTVEVTDGTVDLDFGAINDNAKLSAVVVESVDTNAAPTAANDSATVDAGNSVTINVLANDADSDGTLNASSVQVTSGPATGSTSVLATGEITYNAPSDASGDVTFTYSVADDDGGTDTATVTVSVSGDTGTGTYGMTTGEATNVVIDTSTATNAKATLSGNLTLGDKAEATTYVRFWVEGQPETKYWYDGDTLTQSGEFSIDVVLSPSTTYVWQPLSQSGDGVWKAGAEKTFTTPTGQFFGVDTAGATDVGVETATLNGEILDLGDNDNAQVYFTYWKQGQKNSTLTWYTGPVQDSAGAFSTEVELEPATTYEYRAFGQSNEGEWKAGPVTTFTTQTGQPYGVSTGQATNVSANSATLQGELTGLGDYDSATVYFQYWKQGQKNSTLNWYTGSSQSSPGPYDAVVSGLDAETTYVFQAYAQSNTGKWTAGANETVTTGGDD